MSSKEMRGSGRPQNLATGKLPGGIISVACAGSSNTAFLAPITSKGASEYSLPFAIQSAGMNGRSSMSRSAIDVGR
ncbi:hypothetical protein B0H10DRAFT_2125693, partial [Mycena sp. CBHHK59/15]